MGESDPEFEWSPGKVRVEGDENYRRRAYDAEVYDDRIWLKFDGSGFFSTADEMTIYFEDIRSIDQSGWKTIALRTPGRTVRISNTFDYEEIIDYIRSRIGNRKETNPEESSSTDVDYEMIVADEIRKLADLKEEGIITEDEFEKRKEKLLEKDIE